MTKLLIVFMIIATFIISTTLFYKAAGTLNPGKLNIISAAYYIFMLQFFAGAAFIALGFDKHYTLAYLIDYKRSLNITLVVIMIVSMAFPFCILICQKIMKIKMSQSYNEFLIRHTEYSNDTRIYKTIGSVCAVCSVFLFLILIKIGYIPLFKIVHRENDFLFSTERVRNSTLYIIEPHLSNLVLFTILPLAAYICFAYAISTKAKKWIFLSTVMFLLSVIIKTYKFEKTPLLFHLLIYVLIYIYIKGGIKVVYMGVMGLVGVGILAFSYMSVGFQGAFLDIYNGPLGRTLFTEVGTLSYCFDLFPRVFDFLSGRSFSPTVLKILGMNPELHLRSAKLIMDYYGSEKVFNGTAGVMNTLFVGEAYSNWGYAGVALSIIWVALIFSLVIFAMLKMKKQPVTVTMSAVLTIRFVTIMHGGFCDFIYSFDIIVTVTALLLLHLLLESDNRNYKITNKFKKYCKRKGK